MSAPYWEPGTAYKPGDIVKFEGHRYKIIIPHTSQGDWAPSATPNLWGRLSDEDQGDWDGYKEHHQQPANYKPADEYHPPAPDGQEVNIHHEERGKRWYDIDDKRKKELEVGGGLLAGLAAAAGGYYMYKHHEKNEEDKKADTWSAQNWLHEAEARLNEYRRVGPRGPAQWILNKGNGIPPNAIVAGQERDRTLWISRVYIDGTIQVGKASDNFSKGACVGYDGKEIEFDTYEILVGDIHGLQWVDFGGPLNVESLGRRPVEGGRGKQGEPLYIAKAFHHDATHPGIASANLDGAVISYGGKQVHIRTYSVLCYNF